MTREKIKSGFKWYCQTSMLVGMPITLLICLMFVEKTLFTGTCWLAEYKCENSIGATSAMLEYLGRLTNNDPNVEVNVRSKPKK